MTRTVVVVQARMGSARLPGKSMKPVGGMPIVELVLRRVLRAHSADAVVLATTTKPEDATLVRLAERVGVPYVRGPDHDVLSRFVLAADAHAADRIVRVCADNPFSDPLEIDRIVEAYAASGVDYAFNHRPWLQNGYPDGLGAEVFSREVLGRIDASAQAPDEREHVTVHVWRAPSAFRIGTLKAPNEVAGPDIKLDVDTAADYDRLVALAGEFPAGCVSVTGPQIVAAYRRRFGTTA